MYIVFKLFSLICVCHTLHNVMHHTFQTNPYARDAFDAFKVLSKKLRKSPLCQDRLKRGIKAQLDDPNVPDGIKFILLPTEYFWRNLKTR